jgi:hypothetical protein
VDTAESLHWFSDSWMLWGHWTELFATAARAAHALGDQVMEATHTNYHAWALGALEFEPAAARSRARTARGIARECGDVVQEAWSNFYHAWSSWALDDVPQAEGIEAAEAAVALFTAADEPNGLLSASQTYARALLRADRVDDARPVVARTLRLVSGPTADARIPGHIRRFAMSSLLQDDAFLLMVDGRWEEAEKGLRAALDALADFGIPWRAAQAHTRLAYVLDRQGRTAEAAAERGLAHSFGPRTVPDPVLDRLIAADSAG